NNLLKKELHKAGIKFRPTSINWDNIQGILSRGDRRLAPVLKKVYEYRGSIGSWGRAYKEISSSNEFEIIDYDWYSERLIPFEENLPWDFISTNISKETLHKATKSLTRSFLP
ncbi:MAG: hypothetical protein WC197_08925, partial [Candidatus Gastranaerophilaceae bacterium]